MRSLQASSIAVLPVLPSLIKGFAPYFNKIGIIFPFPASAAKCKEVIPSSSKASTSALLSNNFITILTCSAVPFHTE